MRNYIVLLFSLAFLTACGGGGGGGSTGPTGSTIPVGSVSGTAFDGLILNGTVSVYDFSTGAKGALLGQATTDGNGLYALSLQVESRPVLVEITGGYYVEVLAQMHKSHWIQNTSSRRWPTTQQGCHLKFLRPPIPILPPVLPRIKLARERLLQPRLIMQIHERQVWRV